jgi:phage replication O-like protein O
MKATRIISIGQPRAPQVEDGHTRIANELFEAILRFGLTAREWAVIMTIIRKTYGYNKKQDDISASQIGALCGLARPHVTATLKKLETKKMIHKRAGTYGSVIGIQKRYTCWAKDHRATEKPNTELVLVPNQYEASTNPVQIDSPESVHTKDNLSKENQQKTKSLSAPHAAPGTDLPADFLQFWAVYPNKKNRKAALKAWTALKVNTNKLQTILAAVHVAKKSRNWIEGYAPHGSTYLNGERWTDEIQIAYSADELVVIAEYNTALSNMCGEIDSTIYSETRAGAIRHFRTLSERPEFWLTYFKWVAQHVTLPPSAGFDWLISLDGFIKVKGGQFSKK